MKSGSLNLLEPYGLVQASNGIHLSFTANAQFHVSDRPHCQHYTAHQGRPNFVKGQQPLLWAASCEARLNTGCGRKKSPIWEANKFKTKEDTANVSLFLESTQNAFLHQRVLNKTSLKWRP